MTFFAASSLCISTLLSQTPLANTSGAMSQDQLPRRGALGASFVPLPAAEAQKLNLKPGEGLVARKPVPGLTAEKAGLSDGDILVSINGKPVAAGVIGGFIRSTPSGSPLTLAIVRGGKPMELKTTLLEKPRDPGGPNYEVIYSHVVSHGQRMRTIITVPKKPGKHPGFFFIQGYSPVSYDFKLEGSTGDVATLDGPLLYEFANNDFVTMRVEKPGVGDSEGGPFEDLDYLTELDIYRQALKQLKEHKAVDPSKVMIFGHSMGGAFGPMIAVENPVAAIAVFGTAARTWHEYLLESIRHQGTLAGATPEAVDADVRESSRVIALAFHENKTAEEIKKSHPNLAAAVDGIFPGGKFNNKTLKFWKQLGDINFPSYWAKCNAKVLSVRGATDFVTFDSDHKLIADSVNRARPGSAKFVSVPDTDHVFHEWKTESESQKNFTNGKFNIAFTKLMLDWARQVLGV